MNAVETPANAVGPAGTRREPDTLHPTRRPRRPIFYLAWALILGSLGLVGWIFQDQLRSVVAQARSGKADGAHAGPEPAARAKPTARMIGDGRIVLPESARTAMGLSTVPVLVQTEPIRLELLGTTDTITDTITEVRPMFKGRVDKVLVVLNQPVRKGDPLVDLFSNDLADAIRSYELERIQWLHDKNLLDAREKLIKSNAIAMILFEETRNNEMKSHKEYEVARDKLMLFGLSDAEVERIEGQSGAQKARLTLRSPADGYVIARNVVPGNLYDENDTMLTIAPLERLWVWGNVFESDLDLVRIGQTWEIGFPFLQDKVLGKVEYVSNRVDPNTHAVRVRTSIPNTQGRLKSDMLVRGALAIDPLPGRTVIPRTSLVVDGGHYYAFVRVAGHQDQFERRQVEVAQEKDDHVVVAARLKPGEDVVAVGGLLLGQIYEDLKLLASGAPAVTPAADERAD